MSVVSSQLQYVNSDPANPTPEAPNPKPRGPLVSKLKRALRLPRQVLVMTLGFKFRVIRV